MGERGPTPLPTEIKRRRGTLQLCRMNPDEAKGTPGRPEIPDGLDESELRMWETVCVNLERVGVMVQEHGQAVEALVCEAVRWRRARDRVKALERSTDGSVRVPALVAERRNIDAARDGVVKLCREFGLTPSAATRVRAEAQADKPRGDTARERLRREFGVAR